MFWESKLIQFFAKLDEKINATACALDVKLSSPLSLAQRLETGEKLALLT